MTPSRSLALLFLFVSTIAAAEPFRFEPPAPTSASSVMLRVDTVWRDSCLPRGPVVTRDGSHVDVLWTVPKNVGCLEVITPWKQDVPLGMFGPGTYEVVLRVDDVLGVNTLATKQLAVAEFAPAFRMTPSFANTNGGTVMEFRGTKAELCTSGAEREGEIEIDGVVLPVRQSGCLFTATLPAHSAGSVDVTVRLGGTTTVMRSVLRYADPAVAPDPVVFERVLIPTIFSGPGAFGSQWVTEGEAYNGSDAVVPWFSDVAKPQPCNAPCGISPGSITPLTAFGNHGNGRILFIPRASSADVRFRAIVRDVSREEAYWGAELPIVREKDFRTDTFLFPFVTADPRYRVTLRIYGIDGVPQSAYVAIARNAIPLKNVVVALSAPCSSLPCNSAEPAYASVDISALIPSGTNGPVLLTVQPTGQMWAFLSITNNTTQLVTTVRPQ